MLAFLVSITTSTWWNFTREEFEEKKRHSLTLPIFVVCYSHWCPHCSGLPEGTVQYSDSDGNRTDVIVTMIDCADRSEDCGIFRVPGTPHMVLVIGQRLRYWPRVYSKVGKDWNMFIDKYVKPSLREVTSDSELFEAKREPSDGGTTFHLETPDTANDLMAQLANYSKEYRIYNDTFTYRVNPSLKGPLLTAHVCPYCTTTWTEGPLKDFLEQFKFGSRHEYDQDEYKLLTRRSKAAIVVVDEAIASAQLYALESLPMNYSMEIAFGWLKTKDAKHLLKEFKQNTTDLPFILYTDEHKCRAVYKGRAADAERSGFLEKAISGELCGKTFVNGIVKPISGVASEEPNTTVAQSKDERIGGLAFSTAYILTGLLLTLAIRVLTADQEDKQE
jgi:hypothetical protein